MTSETGSRLARRLLARRLLAPRLLTCGVLAAVALAGCAAAPATPGRSPGSDDAAPAGTVAVLAAASLTDVFTEIAAQVEAANPGLEVTLGFGPSSGLAQQVLAGAPADVLATASSETMASVVDADRVLGEPAVVARNRLELVVPVGNPGGVTSLEDLADADLTVALCADQVPCGAASAVLLDAAGVEAAPDTVERDVRAVLTKVVLGEVDAGLVYRTDVRAVGDAVEGIDVPGADAAVQDYPVAVLADAGDPDAARVFVDHVLSSAGRDVLTAAGFEVP